MALQRPLKEGNVRSYQEKVALSYFDILAAEVDADLDTIYTAWNGNIGTANIQDGAVTSQKIALGAVGSRELADGGVATVDVADGAITLVKTAPALQAPLQGNFTGNVTINGTLYSAGLANTKSYGGARWDTVAGRTYPAGESEIQFPTVIADSGGTTGTPNRLNAPDLYTGRQWCVVSFAGILDANTAGGAGVAIKRWTGTSWLVVAQWYANTLLHCAISTVFPLDHGTLIAAFLTNNTGAARTFSGMFPTLGLVSVGRVD